MKESSNIIVQSSNNGISRIKLNEPSTYNALSLNTLKSLIKSFKIFNNDKKTKVIIIEGSGKGFSAGHNLKEINSLKGKADYQKLFNLCSELMMNIVHNSKPVIAKVHGAAFAAGCQLVATCDLALCTKDAIFATPGVNIGLFCSTPMVALSRNVNRKKTMKMLLTGEPITAQYAKEIGLINDYFDSSKLEEEVSKLATFMETIRSLEGDNKSPVLEQELIDELEKSEKFKDEDEVRRFIRKMINEAAIYESTPGHYNTV